MPEPPDFEAIANQICEAIESPGRSIVEIGDRIAEQLRQVWNARGAADVAMIDTLLEERGLSNAANLDRALRLLDVSDV